MCETSRGCSRPSVTGAAFDPWQQCLACRCDTTAHGVTGSGSFLARCIADFIEQEQSVDDALDASVRLRGMRRRRSHRTTACVLGWDVARLLHGRSAVVRSGPDRTAWLPWDRASLPVLVPRRATPCLRRTRVPRVAWETPGYMRAASSRWRCAARTMIRPLVADRTPASRASQRPHGPNACSRAGPTVLNVALFPRFPRAVNRYRARMRGQRHRIRARVTRPFRQPPDGRISQPPAACDPVAEHGRSASCSVRDHRPPPTRSRPPSMPDLSDSRLMPKHDAQSV